MCATYADTSMTLLRVTLTAELLQVQPLKTFLRIGFAPSAESARATSRLSIKDKSQRIKSRAKCQMMMPAVTETFSECFVPS